MATALPDPRSLYGALVALDRAIANFELDREAARYTKSSSDSRVTATVDGLGRVVSIQIAESQSSLGVLALATKVKDVVNAAIDEASTATGAAIGPFAAALGLPGLPGYGEQPPNYPDFGWIAQQLTTHVIANSPCQSTRLFPCEYQQVAAVVDAQRRIVSLTFLNPLPELMLDLATQIVKALNCAIDDGTNRKPETDGVTGGIINSKGLSDLAIYANGTLKLNDRVHVLGRGCVGFAPVANAGTVETNIGVEARVGSITSSAPVEVRDRGEVHGFVQTAKTVKLNADTEVEGPITENGVVVLPTLTLDVTFPAVTRGTIELEPGQQQTAAPGYYDKCHPKQNAQVFLSSGVYYFNEVMLEPDSKIWLDATNGPIVIWVKNAFTFRGQFLDPSGGFPRVFVGYLGTSMASVERPYRGTLSAPKAKINLATVASPGYEGAFHAKDIEVQPDARICFHPFELLYSDLPGLGAPSTPAADLGFETLQGWTCAQALLTSVANPVTQGAFSLQITNVAAPAVIQSTNFSSSVLPTGATRLLMDLWIPTNQPNATNWGTLSVLLSIPSAGLSGLTLGTLAITGRPRNQFSTFEFSLPTQVRDALATPRSDLSLQIRLNVTAGSSPWYLDNVRFSPPATPPTLESVLSFEDVSKWSCAALALTTSTTQKSHLQRSLCLTNVPSWFEVVSVPFSSATISAPTGKMRMDVWLPSAQPNPSWYGQVQLFVSVPSAGIVGAPSNVVALTSLPTGRFNTLEFSLPSNVKSAIDGTHEDVRLTLAFSLPAGPGPYYLDNIRFV